MESERPLRIVDFSTHMSGPLASHLLMEMGADVIKVEHRFKEMETAATSLGLVVSAICT